MIKRFLWLIACCVVFTAGAQPLGDPQPLKVGYSIALVHITPEKMAEASAAGIEYIETSFGGMLDENRQFKLSEAQVVEIVRKARQAAEAAGIKVWSIHMPYGKNIDLSLTDEAERQKVVALHRQLLTLARVLQPEVILFHPSYYLGLNEREQRKSQMIKSAIALEPFVREIDAIMVIENMLGPELLAGGGRERPLGRTVEEMMEIMGRLPKHIYAAVDMNHIKYPQRLIRALGSRLRSVHVADGSGEREDHFLPCSGKGQNNWTEILSALHEAGYRGPFLFESKFDDVKELNACYQSLYKAFVSERKYSLKP